MAPALESMTKPAAGLPPTPERSPASAAATDHSVTIWRAELSQGAKALAERILASADPEEAMAVAQRACADLRDAVKMGLVARHGSTFDPIVDHDLRRQVAHWAAIGVQLTL